MMHWASMNDFVAMGGYGFYVWVSFGLTVLCMGAELSQLRGRRLALSGRERA